MANRMVYLDNSATTRPYDEVTGEVTRIMREFWGNPSSLHARGIEAEKILNQSRDVISASLKAGPVEVIFTSGGTESNNLALKGAAYANRRKGNHMIGTATAHKSVLNTLQSLEEAGFEVSYLPVDTKGKIDIQQLKETLRGDTILVSIMHVNNETGVIQPVEQVKEIVRSKASQALLHVDAVQSYDKIPFHPETMGIDLATLSAHKIHGPLGIGALYVNKHAMISPVVNGGHQEKGLRGGTENLPGIAGFGKAVQIGFQNQEENKKTLQHLQTAFRSKLLVHFDNILINTPDHTDAAAPHILNVSFCGLRGEVLLRQLESEGIYVSTGSACTSGNSKPSHVLKAMGLDKKALDGAVRFSFSVLNVHDELDYIIDVLKRAEKKQKHLIKS